MPPCSTSTRGSRVHQQGQACVLVLRAMQSREVQQLLSGAAWTELCGQVSGQLTASLEKVGETESKVVKEKVVKTLELCQFLVKNVKQQKLSVDLEPLQTVLQSLTSSIAFKKTGKLEDTYWAVVKHFGVIKPKVEKIKPEKKADPKELLKKKKGFLPESKKRRKRDIPILEPAAAAAAAEQATLRGGKPAAGTGHWKKKHDKKPKQKRPADGAAAAASAASPSPAKKSKTTTTSESNSAKKKKPKQKK